MSDSIQVLDETGRWKARDVRYWKGRWNLLQGQVPRFTTEDFCVGPDGPANPYQRSVVRQPMTRVEKAIPVAVVSNSYTLVQHTEVANKCFEGIQSAGIKTDELECELGLTELGEWMNLRVYFPDRFSHIPFDGNKICLRLECINSVDRSSKLIILLSWLRIICTNGMVVRRTRTELSDIHNEHLDLKQVPIVIGKAMKMVEDDVRRLKGWEERPIPKTFPDWINGTLADRWGKKAACRTFHICQSGHDVEYQDPFALGEPTEKPVKKIRPVPGAPMPARNLYDLSQALSWIATSRPNSEERLDWQSAIPKLMETVESITPA